jgi:hypothetical protein
MRRDRQGKPDRRGACMQVLIIPLVLLLAAAMLIGAVHMFIA